MSHDFPSLAKRYLGPNAAIYVAEKQGHVVGTTILFHREGVGYLTDVGVDHELAGNDFTYFNLVFYRPIADAISMRFSRLYYGTLMYAMKSRRGCSTVDMYLYYKPRSYLLQLLMVPVFAIHHRFKAWFIRRFYM